MSILLKEVRWVAQNLLHIYTKCLSGKWPGNLTRPPSDYCPYETILTGDSAAMVNFVLSSPELHASPANCITPITSKKTMQSKTPPPAFKNMQNNKANHEMWNLLTEEDVINCIPLFHCDSSHPIGYGLEHNFPGVHCLIQDATDSVGAVHRQMSVFYKCSIADSLLIKGRLTPNCNGTHIQVHVVSPLAFSYIDKMNQVTASQC